MCPWLWSRHKAFVDMVREGVQKEGKTRASAGSGSLDSQRSGKLPADLPVYKTDDKL